MLYLSERRWIDLNEVSQKSHCTFVIVELICVVEIFPKSLIYVRMYGGKGGSKELEMDLDSV